MDDLKSLLDSIKEKAKKISILYVEDDEKLQEHMNTFLNKIFDNADVVSNGREGLEKYNKNRYDIVITDINMPEMDGFALIEKIFKTNPNQCVIIVSAYTEPEYLEKSKQLGVSEYISKPVDFGELLNVLQTTVNKISEKNDKNK